MERTEIVSLFKNTPADGTEITVCGWAKNIRDSKNIGFIALSDGGCFKTLQVVLEAGKLANYEGGLSLLIVETVIFDAPTNFIGPCICAIIVVAVPHT